MLGDRETYFGLNSSVDEKHLRTCHLRSGCLSFSFSFRASDHRKGIYVNTTLDDGAAKCRALGTPSGLAAHPAILLSRCTMTASDRGQFFFCSDFCPRCQVGISAG